ncbi:MAG: hypothetical protein ACYC9L_12110 [Sulfuricaulis sp.]
MTNPRRIATLFVASLRNAAGILPIGPRMSVHVELLLLHPAPRVVFGMPIFVSRDAGLLHTILRNHGERWDNASQWFVRYVHEPAQLGLHVEFGHLARGHRYREVLTPHLGPAWRVVWPIDDGRGDTSIRRAEIAVNLGHAWLSVADAAPVRITRDEPGALEAASGNWFTCDGAIALDFSTMPAKADSRVEDIVAELLAQPRFFDPIAARAESCFVFHLDATRSRLKPLTFDIALEPVRRGRLPNRCLAYLFESNLRFLLHEGAP